MYLCRSCTEPCRKMYYIPKAVIVYNVMRSKNGVLCAAAGSLATERSEAYKSAKAHKTIFSRSGVEINFSDVNIVTEVEHFLPREQIFANICSLGSVHFFDSCDKNLMGVFIFFDCCDKNLIVLSRQLLIPLNSSKDDICHHFFILKI
jgi:hypothetical protein